MRLFKNIIETTLRAVVSLLLVIAVSMIYNLVVYKSNSIVVLLVMTITVAMAITLILRRRRIATSVDEANEMFPIAGKLSKRRNIWPALLFTMLDAAGAWNIYCTVFLTAKYAGIDTQMAELYSVSANAVSVMRCIPGTFAARAFYVVVTEMDNFDFSFYDTLVRYDYVLFAWIIVTAIVWTITANIKRYNQSMRNIENANY